MRCPPFLACIGFSLAAFSLAAFEQVDGPAEFDLSWNSLDCGGGASAGGAFELEGTMGQPDAGGPMTGAGFELISGFWPAAAPPEIETCPQDIAPPSAGDNIVNVQDLLAVISAWGACSPGPATCKADISPPPDGDHNVNVQDLLAVISAWGACDR